MENKSPTEARDISQGYTLYTCLALMNLNQ